MTHRFSTTRYIDIERGATSFICPTAVWAKYGARIDVISIWKNPSIQVGFSVSEDLKPFCRRSKRDLLPNFSTTLNLVESISQAGSGSAEVFLSISSGGSKPVYRPNCTPNWWNWPRSIDAVANAAYASCCGVQVDHKRTYRLYRAAGLMARWRRIVMARLRGYPQAIRTDQGPEFTGKTLDQWAYQRNIKLKLTQPGQPTQSAFIGLFNDKLRGECLDEHYSLVEVRICTAAWQDYNEHRPYGAIGNLSPAELAAKWRTSQQQLKWEKLISTL